MVLHFTVSYSSQISYFYTLDPSSPPETPTIPGRIANVKVFIQLGWFVDHLSTFCACLNIRWSYTHGFPFHIEVLAAYNFSNRPS